MNDWYFNYLKDIVTLEKIIGYRTKEQKRIMKSDYGFVGDKELAYDSFVKGFIYNSITDNVKEIIKK